MFHLFKKKKVANYCLYLCIKPDNRNRDFFYESKAAPIKKIVHPSSGRFSIGLPGFNNELEINQFDMVRRGVPPISRRHCFIQYDRKRKFYCLVDNNSRTGTFVNGKKVREEKRLEHNDVIGLIPYEMSGKGNKRFYPARDFIIEIKFVSLESQ